MLRQRREGSCARCSPKVETAPEKGPDGARALGEAACRVQGSRSSSRYLQAPVEEAAGAAGLTCPPSSSPCWRLPRGKWASYQCRSLGYRKAGTSAPRAHLCKEHIKVIIPGERLRGTRESGHRRMGRGEMFGKSLKTVCAFLSRWLSRVCERMENRFSFLRAWEQYECGNVSDTTFLAHPRSFTVRNFQLKHGEINWDTAWQLSAFPNISPHGIESVSRGQWCRGHEQLSVPSPSQWLIWSLIVHLKCNSKVCSKLCHALGNAFLQYVSASGATVMVILVRSSPGRAHGCGCGAWEVRAVPCCPFHGEGRAAPTPALCSGLWSCFVSLVWLPN